MAELFQRNKSTISRHIKNILECGELAADSVVAFFATTIGMTILKKIVLPKRYGKAIYAVSAVLTLAIHHGYISIMGIYLGRDQRKGIQ